MANLFMMEKRRKQDETETRAEMKDRVMFDQVKLSGPTLHATVTGAPM